MIHRSPLPDIEIPDVPLTSYVLTGAQGDKPALIDGASGQVMTYAGLDSAVRSLAGGLVAGGFAKGDVLAQILSAAAPLKVDLADECAKRLDCEVVQGYGMTELSPASHITPPGWFRPGSAGVTVPNTQTRIVDPARGADLGIGEEGDPEVGLRKDPAPGAPRRRGPVTPPGRRPAHAGRASARRRSRARSGDRRPPPPAAASPAASRHSRAR